MQKFLYRCRRCVSRRSSHFAISRACSTSSERPSFIDVVKTAGANAMLGIFTSTGTKFDRTLEGMKVTNVKSGEVTCEIDVTPSLQNAYSTLHGGAICTIVDVVGTMALLSMDPKRAGVSVELNVSFTSAAKANTTVTAIGRVLKHGKRLGFTEVEIWDMTDNKLIATGKHTKAL